MNTNETLAFSGTGGIRSFQRIHAARSSASRCGSRSARFARSRSSSRKVEQVLVAIHHQILPVTTDQRALLAMFHSPAKVARRIPRRISKKRQQIHAVERIFRMRVDARGSEHRRRPVHRQIRHSAHTV